MGLKIINICQPFLLARIPSQNAFAIGCKRSPQTVEIRRAVGERSRMFSFIERRAVPPLLIDQGYAVFAQSVCLVKT